VGGRRVGGARAGAGAGTTVTGAGAASAASSSWPLALPRRPRRRAPFEQPQSLSSCRPLRASRGGGGGSLLTAARPAAATAAPAATAKAPSPLAPVPALFGPPAGRGAAAAPGPPVDTVILLWFKHDLRTDDHPGLLAVERALRDAAAATAAATKSAKTVGGRRVAAVVPVFALDPSLFAHLALTPDGCGALSASLARLRAGLRAMGGDLVVRWAPDGAAAALGEAAAAACAAVALEAAGRAGSSSSPPPPRGLEVVVVAEREVEHAWIAEQERAAAAVRRAAATATAASAAAAHAVRLRWVEWTAPVWPESAFSPYFRDWRRGRGAPHLPLPAADLVGLVPPLPEALLRLGEGDVPSEAAIAEALVARLLAGGGEVAAAADAGAAPAAGAEAVREIMRAAQAAAAGEGPGADAARRLLSALSPALSSSSDPGEDPLALALAAYLDAGGPTSSSDAAAEAAATTGPLRRALAAFFPPAIAALETPAARGASYAALFGRWAQLGAVSPRAVHALACDWERRRWGGNLSVAALARRLGAPSPAAGAALVASELSDFHAQLAAREAALAGEPVRASTPSALALSMASCGEEEESSPGGCGGGGGPSWSLASADGGAAGAFSPSASFSPAAPPPPPSAWPAGEPQVRSWRWRGALTDYVVALPPVGVPAALAADGSSAPPVVLVHGFGAMSQQAAANARGLAAKGFVVFAPTLPGFGRSEKAALAYSQESWRDFLRDFISRVVGRPAVVAGNSIGGFICASLAADFPTLVRGLVLINSAGPIDAAFSAEAHARAVDEKARKGPPPEPVVRAAVAVLMAYLERSVPGQLKWLYPADPAPARGWLADEIQRAAADARAADVFGAVFYLPPPRALNFLVADMYRGPCLVLQGAADPLNDARGRAAQLGALCPANVDVAVMEGRGHCPHHEDSALANAEMEAWMRRRVLC